MEANDLQAVQAPAIKLLTVSVFVVEIPATMEHILIYMYALTMPDLSFWPQGLLSII